VLSGGVPRELRGQTWLLLSGALRKRAEVGSYPIVTFQYSSTTLYQFSLSYSVPVFLK
jgi:hypothetical protein